MRLKLKCPFDKVDNTKQCNRAFYKEHNLITHILFDHLKHIEKIGIISKSQIKLIIKFREVKTLMGVARTQLKRRFLKEAYGKRYDLKDDYQTMLFEDNLNKYHNNQFTRITLMNHALYDKTYAETLEIFKKIETKDLIAG